MVRRCAARQGEARQSRIGEARCGMVRCGVVRRGRQGKAGNGLVRRVKVGHEETWQAGYG